MAGVTGRAELMDAVHPGGLGGTYGGNPVACAAALGAIETMAKEDLPPGPPDRRHHAAAAAKLAGPPPSSATSAAAARWSPSNWSARHAEPDPAAAAGGQGLHAPACSC